MAAVMRGPATKPQRNQTSFGERLLRIRDVISPTLCVRYEEPSGQTLDRMRTFGIEHLIVTQEKTIRGVVSQTELARACSIDADAPVGELATGVPILDSEAPVRDAANLMRSHKVGCVPVIDNHTLAGVVTIETLLELIGEGGVGSQRRSR